MNKIKKIIPRGKWVLVQPIKKESHETEQGLILPASNEQEQKAQGIVLAIGKEANDIKIGAEVIYGAFAGEIIKRRENNKEVEYKLLLDEDIIAILQ